MRQKKASIASLQQQALSKEKALNSAPPKPVSSKTKSKLSSFLFNSGKSKETANDTTPIIEIPDENDMAAMPEPKRKRGQEEDAKEKDSNNNTKTLPSVPPATPIKEHPKTPASRLQLARLMSLAETPPTRGPAHPSSDMSPDDTVQWDTAPRSPFVSSQNLPSGSRRKGVKGTNLETPVPKKKAIDFTINPKTPTADPAAELWSKYSSAEDLASELIHPPLAAKKLFGEKQQRLAGGSPSGLRRAFSCGDSWPRPRPKRRKVEGGLGAGAADVGEDIESPVKSKFSRVSKLVDQMHANLGRPSVPTAPSSPFVPEKGFDHPPSSAPPAPSSPTTRIRRHTEELDIDLERPSSPEQAAPSSPTSRIVRGKENSNPFNQKSDSDSEEYGDMDEDMLEAADEMIAQTQAHGINLFPTNPESPKPSPKTTAVVADSEDEFGDEDFDDAAFQELASKYDANPEQVQHPASPKKAPTQTVPDDDEDEFAEFDDWNVEELEMASVGGPT